MSKLHITCGYFAFSIFHYVFKFLLVQLHLGFTSQSHLLFTFYVLIVELFVYVAAFPVDAYLQKVNLFFLRKLYCIVFLFLLCFVFSHLYC